MKTIISPKFSFNREDFKKSLKNALVFGGPAILVLLASFVGAIPEDFKYGAIALYVLNFATDLFKKWLEENKYQVEK